MVESKRIVLVYPLSMSFFPLNRSFAECRTVRLVWNVRRAPQKVIVTLPGANRALKVVAQCRTMSHDVA